MRFIKEFKSDGAVIFLQELRYDDDGRVTKVFQYPQPTAFALPPDGMTYDNDNRLETWNEQTVTHDEDGNMTAGPLPSGAMGSYGYNVRNQLTSTSGATTYRYNAEGLRVASLVGVTASTFVVDPNATLSRVLLRTKGSTTTYYVYGLGLLYEETAGATKTYHGNQVGSTMAITDDNENVTDRVNYAPYGAVVARTGTTDTPFLFNGEWGVMTEANGLLFMRARYYNPRLMRFLNADPIGFAGGLNHYAFVGNNPISFTDPWGLCKDESVDWWDVVVILADVTATVVRTNVRAADTTARTLWDATSTVGETLHDVETTLGARKPDYYSANVNIAIPTPWTGTLLGWSGTVSLDRYGNWYWSPLGWGAGKSATVASGSLTANWFNQRLTPTALQLKGFLTKDGWSSAVANGLAFSESYSPSSGFATGVGIGTPQAGISYNYSFEVGVLDEGDNGW